MSIHVQLLFGLRKCDGACCWEEKSKFQATESIHDSAPLQSTSHSVTLQSTIQHRAPKAVHLHSTESDIREAVQMAEIEYKNSRVC